MSYKSPGKAHRTGISLLELAEMFPNEEAASRWFESWMWPNGEITCLRCGSCNAYRVKSGKPMPYRCRDCRKVKAGIDDSSIWKLMRVFWETVGIMSSVPKLVREDLPQ